MGRRLACLVALLAVAVNGPARAHDIPNARVDRSIQATVRPGRLALDYEVSLSELTLTQDLRALIGALPGAGPSEWFERYGRETGPMNAKGVLVKVDGRPLPLSADGFDLKVEEHPRYTFHFSAPIPSGGRLAVLDTNFAGSEGTSRLAIRALDGATVSGDDLPSDVSRIEARPVWQLTDVEERRTKQVEVDFRSPARAPEGKPPGPGLPVASETPKAGPARGLSGLLERASGLSLLTLGLIAFGLGAAHAVQPGHGKTLVAATVVGERGGRLRGALLAGVITLTHTGSVLLVALGLWWFQSTRYGAVNQALARLAGFLIAAIGLWRLGRHLAGFGEHDGPVPHDDESPEVRGLIGLGMAGGLVPCWDAVGLIVLAEALGRLALGIVLLVAFGLGMACVLVLIGMLAGRLRRAFPDRADGRRERGFGIASGVVLAAIGLYLLVSA